MNDLALYIHWPFCRAKCPYCDFNSHVREEIDLLQWKKALLQELRHMAEPLGPRQLSSIFFGGGTPSLMPPELVAEIIVEARRIWPNPNIEQEVEITLEANPNSAEQEKFRSFREAGINRLSLGVQSFDDQALHFLGRLHDSAEAKRAIAWAAEIFPRFSFDLIYALPGQKLTDWARELDRAFAFDPHHLSLYQLTIEKATKFEQSYDRGDFIMLDEDQSLAFFLHTQERLEKVGLPAYEISNHAKEGDESRHNLSYWRYRDYLGIGPGAHGRLSIGGKRFAQRQHRAPEIWLERVLSEGHATQDMIPLSPEEQRQEQILMGLRLREGVARDLIDPSKLPPLLDGGLMLAEGDKVRLTPAGRPLLNAILARLLSN